MQLITSGNPNLKSVRGVLYFANEFALEKHREPISKVTFIDNEGSIVDQDKKNIEGERNLIARHYLNNPSIESIYIKKEQLHIEIPRIIAEKLKVSNHSQLIVDLTNGDKYTSSALYASASLSQIRNLFFLLVGYDKKEHPPEDLEKSDYSIEVVSPLEEIESIGRHTYFDIVYYKDKIEKILKEFNGSKFESSFLDRMLAIQLNSCIDNYFLNKYPESINTIGQLIEEVSYELARCINEKYEIRKNSPNDFNQAICFLSSNFCKPLTKDENFAFRDQFKDLKFIDKIAELIRVYRNINSHPNDSLRDKEEAQLVINSSLYLLDKLAKSKIFIS